MATAHHIEPKDPPIKMYISGNIIKILIIILAQLGYEISKAKIISSHNCNSLEPHIGDDNLFLHKPIE